MNIVIVEDERITAADLKQTIESILPEANVEEILDSVKEAIEYFKTHSMPDLIFCDVQLGDGVSFEIFKAVKITSPVVFCTAYDEYALEAFKTNSIDYVLKPFDSDAISGAIEKYKQMKMALSDEKHDYDEIVDLLLQKNKSNTGSILVNYKDKILPIRLTDVAIFYIEDEIVSLITLDGTKYNLTKTLDELNKLTGDDFFRANRQCLLNKKAVIDVSYYFSNKLSVNISVPFKDKITISRMKKTAFLNWLEAE